LRETLSLRCWQKQNRGLILLIPAVAYPKNSPSKSPVLAVFLTQVNSFGLSSGIKLQGSGIHGISALADRNEFDADDDPPPILPGMSATVDILTTSKAILQYLLKPVFRAREVRRFDNVERTGIAGEGTHARS
jgi:hypothetical protein